RRTDSGAAPSRNALRPSWSGQNAVADRPWLGRSTPLPVLHPAPLSSDGIDGHYVLGRGPSCGARRTAPATPAAPPATRRQLPREADAPPPAPAPWLRSARC